MKLMRIFLIVFACHLPVGVAGATQTAERPFTCPVDDKAFTGTIVTKTNNQGGVDSDFCPYAAGGHALPHEIHTCPTCGFTASTGEFEQQLNAQLKKNLLETLAKWKTANNVTDWARLPVWQRYELAAICGYAKFAGQAHAGRLYMRAAWSARR